MPEVFLALFALAVVAAVGFRLLAGNLDHGRIRAYVADRGGRVLEIRWAPFGPGWFGEKTDRIYDVRYIDRAGNERRAACKTSLTTGVYFTYDEVIRPAERPIEPAVDRAELEAENRRLREELARLRREQGEFRE
jgi:hypothetical protein